MEINLSTIKEVAIPDIGTDSQVDVIEVSATPGKKINKEDPLITLESDKATMEIPSPYSGVVKEVKIKIGDKVSNGTLILTMEVTGAEETESAAGSSESKPSATPEKTPAPAAAPVSPAPAKSESTPVASAASASTTATSAPASVAPADAAAVGTGSGPTPRPHPSLAPP